VGNKTKNPNKDDHHNSQFPFFFAFLFSSSQPPRSYFVVFKVVFFTIFSLVFHYSCFWCACHIFFFLARKGRSPTLLPPSPHRCHYLFSPLPLFFSRAALLFLTCSALQQQSPWLFFFLFSVCFLVLYRVVVFELVEGG
jgi:hypothetical protein